MIKIILCTFFLLTTFIVYAVNPDPGPYLAKYVEPEPGQPDYHNPWADDYCYGGIHHRLGQNCPQSYYDLCEIWKIYGEMYDAGELKLWQLKEMDYYIFAVNKGTTDPEEVAEIVAEYYEKHIKR